MMRSQKKLGSQQDQLLMTQMLLLLDFHQDRYHLRRSKFQSRSWKKIIRDRLSLYFRMEPRSRGVCTKKRISNKDLPIKNYQ
jgi:hypothetical protein